MGQRYGNHKVRGLHCKGRRGRGGVVAEFPGHIQLTYALLYWPCEVWHCHAKGWRRWSRTRVDFDSKVYFGGLVVFRIYCGTAWQELDEKVSVVIKEKGEHDSLGTGLRLRLIWQRWHVLPLHAVSKILGHDNGKWIYPSKQYTTEKTCLPLGISSDVTSTHAEIEPSAHLSGSAGPNGYTPICSQYTNIGWCECYYD